MGAPAGRTSPRDVPKRLDPFRPERNRGHRHRPGRRGHHCSSARFGRGIGFSRSTPPFTGCTSLPPTSTANAKCPSRPSRSRTKDRGGLPPRTGRNKPRFSARSEPRTRAQTRDNRRSAWAGQAPRPMPSPPQTQQSDLERGCPERACGTSPWWFLYPLAHTALGSRWPAGTGVPVRAEALARRPARRPQRQRPPSLHRLPA